MFKNFDVKDFVSGFETFSVWTPNMAWLTNYCRHLTVEEEARANEVTTKVKT